MVREKRSKTANHVNRHVGRKIAVFRVAAGLHLTGLAARTGISARALARIEAGEREADAGQLLALAEALDFPVEVLFERLAANLGAKGATAQSPDRLREAEALVAVFHRIADPEHRRRIVTLLKACADSGRY
jgi:transcriptional regulator with XRE-family HTH domain